MRPIRAALCALALVSPTVSLADPVSLPELPLAAGATCGEVDERNLGRIPVEIIVSPQAMERHQRDEYVVLSNDGTTYREPVFVDTSEAVAPPPLR